MLDVYIDKKSTNILDLELRYILEELLLGGLGGVKMETIFDKSGKRIKNWTSTLKVPPPF